MRHSAGYRLILSAALVAFICASSATHAQGAKAPAYSAHLPYSFSNFVWWNDDELRALLKKRIPGLGDEIATNNPAEGRVRDALTALMKEKGIVAEIQSEEPSTSAFRPLTANMVGMGDMEVPTFHPTVVFSLLRPKVVLGHVTVQSEASDLIEAVEAELKGDEGKAFGAGMVSFSQTRVEEIAKKKGYLGEQVLFRRMPTHKVEDSYATDVTVVVSAGPRYRIGALHADGGPLFEGKDLMQFVRARIGDAAGGSPFGTIGPQLRAYYQQCGFADVMVKAEQTLNSKEATVAYSLKVIPGPIYHLRSLTIEKLKPDQENRVRELLGMKPGEIFRDQAITDLYHEIAAEPLLKGYTFGFSPKADKAAAAIDLSLTFSKEGGNATVTVQ